MSSRIQLRRGTAAQWTSETLTAGEIGYETDTGNFKIGDGSTGWATLAYFMSPLLTSAFVDLNNADYLRMGRFDLAAPATTYTNGPALLDAAEGASKLIVTKTGAGYIQQIVSTNYFFTRAYIGGSWRAWKELPTSATLNTANTLVRRDASGNFAAGTITAAAFTGALTGNVIGNVTGNVTGSSGSSTGNAATATTLATGRTIAISGDITYTSPSFDGSGNVTAAATLAAVASAGTTGSSTAIPVVTINAKGLTTGITTVAVVAPAGTLSGATLASGVTASSLQSVGTLTSLSVANNLSFNSGYGSSTVGYGCRAWVNFNGTGTVAINASGNVSSISDNGAGDYTANFTTSMPDNVYCIATSGARTAGEIQVIGVDYVTPTKTASAVRLGAKTYAIGKSDSAECNVAIFR